MSPTNILEKMRLAEGVELIPIREVSDMPEFKDLEYEADDYVLNKVRSRHRSKIISRDMAMFLKNFEKPATIVEAVIDYAAVLQEDPTQMLADAHPFIMNLVRDELLVFEWEDSTGSVFKAGEVFEGYTIRKIIHQLEDTEIYEADADDKACKTVILKVGIDKTGRDKIKHNFDNEAAILKSLSDTINAKLIAHGEHEDNPYIILEKIENSPITDYANRLRAKSQFQELVQLMKNIVAAYNQLHKEGIYHVDINPRNILIDQEGKIYIIDFGLSCFSDNKTRLMPPLDYFSPPEILMFRNGSKRRWDFFCEQYSIAALIYYLYTGKHPINFSFEGEVMQRQLVEEPVLSFEEQGLAAFNDLEQLLKRCLAKNPELRYPDLDEIIAGLDSLQYAKFPEIAQREYALDNLSLYNDTDELINTLATEKTIREYFNRGPSCSIFNGGAGIAYFLYRMALHHKSAELISLADVWCNRSKAMSHEESAYINKELGFEAKDVDRISIFNHEPGLHFVQALISSSIGDINTTVKSVEKIIDISKSGSSNQDMTMGKSGILLALATIIESIPVFYGFNNDAIIKYGNDLLSTIWEDKTPTIISDDYSVKFTGVAHGWAGIIYAALKWQKAIGQPGPTWLENKIGELFDVREEHGDLIVWKNKINARNYYYMPGWCNGGAGFIELFRFAADVYQKAEYLDMAEKIAIDVYNNPSMTADLCCGFAGRAYSLLGLYQSTQNEKYFDQTEALLAKSKQVTSFLKVDSLFKGKFGLKLLEIEMEKMNPMSFPCM